MALFSAKVDYRIENPKTTKIDGEVNGSYFSGRIEMTYLNETKDLKKYTISIGENSSNICLHDFNIKIDKNPFIIKIMEKEEARKIFKNKIRDNEQAVFGEGSDSYTTIEIPNVLPNQVLTISAEFEIPVSFPSKNTIGVIFPLTCPSDYGDPTILKCSDFHFSSKFS